MYRKWDQKYITKATFIDLCLCHCFQHPTKPARILDAYNLGVMYDKNYK